MKTKDADEVEIVFEQKLDHKEPYPYVRQIAVHMYGSESAERCIESSRKEHNLPENKWIVVGYTGRDIV